MVKSLFGNAPLSVVQVPVSKPFQMAELTSLGQDTINSISTTASKINAQAKGGDLDEVGKLLGNLLVVAKGYDPTSVSKKSLFNLFGLFKAKVQELKNQFSSVDSQITALSKEIENHIVHINSRIPQMETLEAENKQRHAQMGMVIESALERIEWMKNNPPLVTQSDSFSVQEKNNWDQVIQMAEKRVDDLGRVQMMAEQQIPRLQQMKVNAVNLVTKFNDSLKLVIPAWQQLSAEYIFSLEQKKAADLQDSISDAFNEAQIKSAELFKQNTVQISNSLSRSVIDTKTLQTTQNLLLSTIEEVKKIAETGKARLATDKVELDALSTQLNQLLLK